jgi:hypothetical protein
MNQTLLITSIAPPIDQKNSIDESKYNWQNLCIKSWQVAGHDILSINTISEISVLKNIYTNINFEEAFRSTFNINNRNLIFISDALYFAKLKNYKRIAISNSDVLITTNVSKLEAELYKDNLFYSHRLNIDDIYSSSGELFTGIDYCNMSSQLANSLPESYFTFGLPWWDYWIPYYCLSNNKIISQLTDSDNQPILLHKKHKDVWSPSDLCIMGKHFFNLCSNNGLINIRSNGLLTLYNEFDFNLNYHKVHFYAKLAQTSCGFIRESSNIYKL